MPLITWGYITWFTSKKLYISTSMVSSISKSAMAETRIRTLMLFKYAELPKVWKLYLPRTLAGDWPHLSLPISSSTSLLSKQMPFWFTLNSELALLLVAWGEPETLIVRPWWDPDLTLYKEDAGMFVIKGRKLPGMVLRISYSKDKQAKW